MVALQIHREAYLQLFTTEARAGRPKAM